MKQYIYRTALISLALCVSMALFNYVVDPYALYHLKSLDDDRLSRIDQFHHMRISKPWHVYRTRPTAVIVGTSRTARVPPVHPSWDQESSYNLSIPGQTVYEMSRFIEHAQSNGPLEKLMIGLDFEAFIRPQPITLLGFEEDRLARTPDELNALRFSLQRATDAVNTLLSVPAFTRSLSAISGTGHAGRRYFKDGTWETTSKKLTGRGGYIYIGKSTIFSQHTKQLDLQVNFEIFAEILRFAHGNDIETRLFITPEHVFMIDLWHRLGYETLWTEFHHGLVNINNSIAQALGKKAFPIVGFNQLRGIVDEPINKARDSKHSLFKDGAHFRKELGYQIMRAVWSDNDTSGWPLDAASVAPYLLEVERLQQDFESSNSNLTSSLRKKISPSLEQ